MPQYGVYDTQDALWIGDDKGPKLLDSKELAQIACQVIAEQLGFAPTRLRPRKFTAKTLKRRDRLPVKYDGEEALKRVMGGHPL